MAMKRANGAKGMQTSDICECTTMIRKCKIWFMAFSYWSTMCCLCNCFSCQLNATAPPNACQCRQILISECKERQHSAHDPCVAVFAVLYQYAGRNFNVNLPICFSLSYFEIFFKLLKIRRSNGSHHVSKISLFGQFELLFLQQTEMCLK